MIDVPEAMQAAIQQSGLTLSHPEVCNWAYWTLTQPDYYWAVVGKAGCIVKVTDQIDPPWQRVAHEAAWWGHGKDAVRALHRGMDWARLQGAIRFGYSVAPRLDLIKWRKL